MVGRSEIRFWSGGGEESRRLVQRVTASPVAPHRTGPEVCPHPALRRCSRHSCRSRLPSNRPSERLHSQPFEPGVVVLVRPARPSPAPLLAAEQREALVDVAVDLGEHSRRVPPTEVVAPASQNRAGLLQNPRPGLLPSPKSAGLGPLGPSRVVLSTRQSSPTLRPAASLLLASTLGSHLTLEVDFRAPLVACPGGTHTRRSFGPLLGTPLFEPPT